MSQTTEMGGGNRLDEAGVMATVIPANPNEAPWFPYSPNKLREAGKWLFLLLTAGYFAMNYAALILFLDLRLYAMGGERLPYQGRVLPMIVFRGLMDRPWILRAAHFAAPLGRDQFRLILALMVFVCIVVAVKATEATIARLTGDRVYAFWGSLLMLAMAQIALGNSQFTAPYDVPSLMFFAIALYLIVRRWWWAYYAVFVLAVLNREAACFITVFLAVWEWVRLEDDGSSTGERMRKVAPHVVAQAAIWIGLKIAIGTHFAHNPHENTVAGGAFTTQFALYNVKELFKPWQWPLLLSVCGFSLPFLWLQRRWIGYRPLVWATAVTIGLSFLGLMIVGVVVEIRIFADWIAMAAPAMGLVIWHRFRPVRETVAV